MTVKILLFALMFFELKPLEANGKEIICNINGRKPLNVADEKFIGLSVDPLMINNLFNMSTASLYLVKNLTPAYLRISGPSTRNLRFSGEDAMKPLHNGISFTPSMWKSLNGWLSDTNLIPIYSISKHVLLDGGLESFLSSLSNYDQENTTYWELSYDFNNEESLFMYAEHLSNLKNLLNKYLPSSKIEANLININWETSSHKSLKELDDLVNVINWDRSNSAQILKQTLNSIHPVWVTTPKCENHSTFASALQWAMQMGKSASLGYKVIFGYLDVEEHFTDSPAYWLSLIYRMVMGKTVLDVKIVNFDSRANVTVFAHCARKEETSKSGGITVFAVNANSFGITVLIRGLYVRNVEMQSYILTSDGENARHIYLNEEMLTLNNSILKPNFQRSRITRGINLILPQMSIGFFVFPNVKIPACIKKESQTRPFLNALRQDDDNEQLINTLEELTPHVPDEYKDFDDSKAINYLRDNRNSKLAKRKLVPRLDKVGGEMRKIELELTNEEIKKILKDRTKFETRRKGLNLESGELESIMIDVAKNMIKKEGSKGVDLSEKLKGLSKNKRMALVNRLMNRFKRFNRNTRQKRGININLLMEKIKMQTEKKKKIRRFEDSVETKYTIEADAGMASSYEDSPHCEDCHQVRVVDERVEFLNGPRYSSRLDDFEDNQGNLKFMKVIKSRDNTNAELFKLQTLKNMDSNYTNYIRHKRNIDNLKNYTRLIKEKKRTIKQAINNGRKSKPVEINNVLEDGIVDKNRKRKRQMNRLMSRFQKRLYSERQKRHLYKPWKPENILELKRIPSLSIEINDDLLPRAVKHKRSLDSINSEENTIENYPSVQKFSKLFDVAKGNSSSVQTEATTRINTLKSTASISEASVTTSQHPSSTTSSLDFKSKEGSLNNLATPNFINMIVNAVNKTISNVARFSEKFAKFYPFLL